MITFLELADDSMRWNEIGKFLLQFEEVSKPKNGTALSSTLSRGGSLERFLRDTPVMCVQGMEQPYEDGIHNGRSGQDLQS